MLEFDPGEAAQVDFGKGPDVVNPRSGKVAWTWVFVMTLAWSRHAYAELVIDQTVATWLDCHRRAFESMNPMPELSPTLKQLHERCPQTPIEEIIHPSETSGSTPAGGSITPTMGGAIEAVSDSQCGTAAQTDS